MLFLEDYTLLDELGCGGFATVYKVRHNKLGYIRAVRVLKELITKGVDDDRYKKFEKECKVLLRLGNGCHPNIVRIYQPYLKDMKALVEMDYVDGMDIVHFLKKKDNFLEIDEVMNLLSQISDALAYCHEDIYKFCMNRDEDNLKTDPNDGSKVLMDDNTKRRLIEKYRVVHNDIHHGNIMRRENGTYVLLDFGLAIDGDEVVRSSRFQNGVPEFMAPEKWDSDSITTQSDIYSFGILLYECLAGRLPFVYDANMYSKEAVRFRLQNDHKYGKLEPILSLRKAAFEKSHKGQSYTKDYPDWLEQLIMKCLAKKPSDRFANGKELHDFVVKQLGNENGGNLKNANEQITLLEQQVVSLQNEIKNLKASSTNQKNVDKLVIDLQVRLKELETAKSSLENKIKAYQTENEALRLLSKGHDGDADTINKLRGENATLDKEKKGLNARLQELSTKLSSATDEIKNLKKDNSQLRQELKDLKNKNGISKPVFYFVLVVLLILCAAGFKSYFDENAENSKLKNEYSSMLNNKNDEIKQLNAEVSSLKQQLAAKPGSGKYSQGDMDAKNNEINQLNAEVNSLKQQLAAKSGSGKYSQSDMDAKDKTIKQLQSVINDKNKQISDKNKQISAKDKQISAKDKQISAKDKQISALEGALGM